MLTVLSPLIRRVKPHRKFAVPSPASYPCSISLFCLSADPCYCWPYFYSDHSMISRFCHILSIFINMISLLVLRLLPCNITWPTKYSLSKFVIDRLCKMTNHRPQRNLQESPAWRINEKIYWKATDLTGTSLRGYSVGHPPTLKMCHFAAQKRQYNVSYDLCP